MTIFRRPAGMVLGLVLVASALAALAATTLPSATQRDFRAGLRGRAGQGRGSPGAAHAGSRPHKRIPERRQGSAAVGGKHQFGKEDTPGSASAGLPVPRVA